MVKNRTNNPLWIGNLYRHRVAAGETTFDADAALAAAKPTGEWQLFEIDVLDDRLTVQLNGVVVTRATNIVNPRGHIGIQGETGAFEPGQSRSASTNSSVQNWRSRWVAANGVPAGAFRRSSGRPRALVEGRGANPSGRFAAEHRVGLFASRATASFETRPSTATRSRTPNGTESALSALPVRRLKFECHEDIVRDLGTRTECQSARPARSRSADSTRRVEHDNGRRANLPALLEPFPNQR